MTTLLVAVFVASLVGSLHCVGMCGGVVALCVGGRPAAGGARTMAPHVLYNLGRMLTYVTLGAVSGAVGAAVDIGGAATGFSRVAAVLAGAAMIVVGAVALLRAIGVVVRCPRLPAPVQRVFQTGMRAVTGAPPAVRPLLIGGLTGLLPCGWLYAFVISAAGTGHPVLGAMTMAAFWAGTVPAMLAVGIGVQSISASVRRFVPKLTAIALLVIGVLTVVGRLQVPAYAETLATPVAVEGVAHVHVPDASGRLCCHDER